MVRLLPIAFNAEFVFMIRFNPTMVRLLHIMRYGLWLWAMVSFNPTMVRLLLDSKRRNGDK